ncbi:2-succinyl-6-hydroxy-2,4-cyclohexadiene-1-carboxylate synthase, partial [bacterium]|nr:2-succinyl-6-hydroxy-2,4-cyclohexadiene-1-carboxylate synthase [bacterium]
DALLLLHGFLGRGADWRDLAAATAPGCRCIMPDLPGHGASIGADRPADYGVAATAAALIGILDTMALERVDLLGYSLGGRVALYTALHYPGRVGRLVLESASPGLAAEDDRRQRLDEDRLRAGTLRSEGIAVFVDAWFDQPLFASLRRRPDLLARLKRRRRRCDAAGLALSLENIGTGRFPSLWQRLPDLEMPVLLVCGGLDDKYRTLNGSMAGLMPDARLVTVADAGHNVHLERPAAFARIVREFLWEPPARATDRRR